MPHITLTVDDTLYQEMSRFARLTGVQVMDCPIEIMLQKAFQVYYFIAMSQLCGKDVVFLEPTEIERIEQSRLLNGERNMVAELIAPEHAGVARRYFETIQTPDICFVR